MKRYYGSEDEADNANDSEYRSKKREKKLLKKLLAEAERQRKFKESETIKDASLEESSGGEDKNRAPEHEQVALDDTNKEQKVENIKTSNCDKDYEKQEKRLAGTDENYSSSEESSSDENDGISVKSDIGIKRKRVASSGKGIGFTILGEAEKQRKKKIQRVLPDWLANPFVVTSDLCGRKKTVDDCQNLDISIRQKLNGSGITEFFPVQQEVVPQLIHMNSRRWLCRPGDLCVSAPTGSGKTLAFVLPVIQSLKDRVVTAVRCLAVLPVRDLAVQVYNVFKHYSKGTSLSVAQITGISSFSEEQTLLARKGIRGYQSLADIVVATPGRLIDHIHSTPGFSLQHLRFLILDEADRMMDEIQEGWLSEVEKAIYGENIKLYNCCAIDKLFLMQKNNFITACSFGQVFDPLQKLLYSATLSQDSEKIEQLSLFCPKLICVNPSIETSQKSKSKGKLEAAETIAPQTNIKKYVTPVELEEYYVICELSIKPLIAWHLIKSKQFKRVLCFTKSVESSHRLSLVLKEIGEFTVSEFSSRLSGIQRKTTLKSFLSGNTKVLVCSDVMARGMDIEDIDCVMLYDIPTHARTYVHRVGRTARAGKSGTAITLMESHERKKFLFMMKSVSRNSMSELQISHAELEPFQQRYQTALKNTSSSIQTEHHQEILKKHPAKKKKYQTKVVKEKYF